MMTIFPIAFIFTFLYRYLNYWNLNTKASLDKYESKHMMLLDITYYISLIGYWIWLIFSLVTTFNPFLWALLISNVMTSVVIWLIGYGRMHRNLLLLTIVLLGIISFS